VVLAASQRTDAGLAATWSGRPLRVAIVNVMPRAETYEGYLLRPLARALVPVEPVWIRLESHGYGSSDAAHIEQRYLTFDRATASAIDGVLLTGAPVEELAFDDVHYWPELTAILEHGRARSAGVFGICWGGLALAKLLGIEKERSAKKIFGAFENRVLEPEHPILGGSDDVFWCAHSRHAGVRKGELEAARDAGLVRLLSHGPETGYSIFESVDRRLFMHLGHPEYEAARLVHEWERDAALGRSDVDPPRHFDLARPLNVWKSHCNDVFERWLRHLALARAG
jgi:homoserine O-succinyltransferase